MKSNRKKLVKDLDDIFSKWIRLEDSIDGMTMCVTCNEMKPWQQMQAGHFYSRGRFPTRWDKANVYPQCVRCNIFLKGNYIDYTKFMLDVYGRDFIDELEIKSKSSIKLTSVEMTDLITKYKNLVATY